MSNLEYVFRVKYLQDIFNHFLSKNKKIAIFPGGAHTKWLLNEISVGTSVKCILDDNARGDINGIEITSTGRLEELEVDTIFISSDSSETKLKDIARKKFPAVDIYCPYEGVESGPYYVRNNEDNSNHPLQKILNDLKPYFGNTLSARENFNRAQKNGLHIIPNHFYYPVPDTSKISANHFDTVCELPGIEMNESSQIHLLENVFSEYKNDFLKFNFEKSEDEMEFSFQNDQISGADPFIIHALIKHLKPKKVLEIGSGHSTKVAVKALKENQSGNIICIEPYPQTFLEGLLKNTGTLYQKSLCDIPIEMLTDLNEGDIFFIDSSHVCKIGSDVQYLFLEVLPRLPKGVWVHIHDIFIPFDYPSDWIQNMNFFWNEQYLLQSYLVNNSKIEIKFSVSYMGWYHEQKMKEVFPHFERGLGGGSFWYKTI